VQKRCAAARAVPRAGLEAAECQRLIEAHKECLRAEGFRVRRPTCPCLALPACTFKLHPALNDATAVTGAPNRYATLVSSVGVCAGLRRALRLCCPILAALGLRAAGYGGHLANRHSRLRGPRQRGARRVGQRRRR